MINFIFYGRLEIEKGFDYLIDSIKLLDGTEGFKNMKFFIFCDGSLKKYMLEELGGKKYFIDYSSLFIDFEDIDPNKNVYFFGWQPIKNINQYQEKSHFVLMPSKFLETFGLNALESIEMGVPIIGFKKGSLQNFISEKNTISFTNDEQNILNLKNKLEDITLNFNEKDWIKESKEARITSENYSRENWYHTFKNTFPDAKKILMVTDYIWPIGGIETHVNTISNFLISKDFKVDKFGLESNAKPKRLRMLLNLVITGFNFLYMGKIKNKISHFSPDLIWCHSIGRFLGPLVLLIITGSKIKTAITYHDFGIFSPYPSLVNDLNDFPKKWNISEFFRVSKKKKLFPYIALFFKFLQLTILRFFIRKISIHFVPSEYMKDIVEKLLKIDRDKIITLPHFTGI